MSIMYEITGGTMTAAEQFLSPDEILISNTKKGDVEKAKSLAAVVKIAGILRSPHETTVTMVEEVRETLFTLDAKSVRKYRKAIRKVLKLVEYKQEAQIQQSEYQETLSSYQLEASIIESVNTEPPVVAESMDKQNPPYLNVEADALPTPEAPGSSEVKSPVEIAEEDSNPESTELPISAQTDETVPENEPADISDDLNSELTQAAIEDPYAVKFFVNKNESVNEVDGGQGRDEQNVEFIKTVTDVAVSGGNDALNEETDSAQNQTLDQAVEASEETIMENSKKYLESYFGPLSELLLERSDIEIIADIIMEMRGTPVAATKMDYHLLLVMKLQGETDAKIAEELQSTAKSIAQTAYNIRNKFIKQYPDVEERATLFRQKFALAKQRDVKETLSDTAAQSIERAIELQPAVLFEPIDEVVAAQHDESEAAVVTGDSESRKENIELSPREILKQAADSPALVSSKEWSDAATVGIKSAIVDTLSGTENQAQALWDRVHFHAGVHDAAPSDDLKSVVSLMKTTVYQALNNKVFEDGAPENIALRALVNSSGGIKTMDDIMREVRKKHRQLTKDMVQRHVVSAIVEAISA